MDRGRRATLEERIAIVKYTLDHCNDYREAAKHFNVSYPQVYTWVRKYRQTCKYNIKGSNFNILLLFKYLTVRFFDCMLITSIRVYEHTFLNASKITALTNLF
ncbi:hypothetical protein WP50_34300 [Lactiplantibacillus plantarum]|nr:hypothetical protein WP50_34300 [Lactiplantibacillus plantarum]